MRNTKNQKPNINKRPGFKRQSEREGTPLNFGVWDFVGVWCLDFGV
jgi:hypothetical protein